MQNKIAHIVLGLILLLSPLTGKAETQSLSVTPPLFQLSVEPGDIWQSSVRVVNTNDFPLSVYAEVVNFLPEGEEGMGKFMPILDTENTKATLAEWIQIPKGPHMIPPGDSKEISFFVEVPPDAAPGGHFAAILVSTEPPHSPDSPLALVTTQTVATLFFTRIEGDVVEKADIREFTVMDRSIELPQAEFSLRFENKGNVHLQPRGDIVITNMWGKERGVIPINHDTHFGNVLPESIRDFHFSWKGERSLTDIGRYKAIATLAYGEDGIKSVSTVTYFWVIPIKGTLITLGALLFIILSITWMIKRYIRHMLELAGVDPDRKEDPQPEVRSQKPELRLTSYKAMSAPIRKGAKELRSDLHDENGFIDVLRTVFRFVGKYYRFFLALVIIIAGFVGLVLYVGEVSETDVDYEVTIEEGNTTRILTDEEVKTTRSE